MERTDPRGAEELYRYYEVHETIGAGKVHSEIQCIDISCVCLCMDRGEEKGICVNHFLDSCLHP